MYVTDTIFRLRGCVQSSLQCCGQSLYKILLFILVFNFIIRLVDIFYLFFGSSTYRTYVCYPGLSGVVPYSNCEYSVFWVIVRQSVCGIEADQVK